MGIVKNCQPALSRQGRGQEIDNTQTDQNFFQIGSMTRTGDENFRQTYCSDRNRAEH